MLGQHAVGGLGCRPGHNHLARQLVVAEIEQRQLSQRIARQEGGVFQMYSAEGGNRTADRRQIDRCDTGGIRRRPAQHVLGIGHRVVVAQDRGQHLGLVAQVQTTAAQVACCREGGVEQVLWVGPAVAIAVGGVSRPGPGQELHGTHRPGVGGAATDVALHDDLVAGQASVQRRAVDGPDRRPACVGGAAVGV